MARPFITPISRTAAESNQKLLDQVNLVLRELEGQLQNSPNTSSSQTSNIEQGLRAGDPIFRLVRGVLKVGIWNGKQARFLNGEDLQLLQKNGTNFLGRIEGTGLVTAASTLALFPLQNDWGFYHRTTGADTLFLVYNLDGATLFNVQLT